MLFYHPTPTGRYPTSDMVSSVEDSDAHRWSISIIHGMYMSTVLGIRRYDRYHVKA